MGHVSAGACGRHGGCVRGWAERVEGGADVPEVVDALEGRVRGWRAHGAGGWRVAGHVGLQGLR